MNNYALDTPTKRKVWTPPNETMVKNVEHSGQIDQTHRFMQWLFHRPQDHSVFPRPAEATRFEKKK